MAIENRSVIFLSCFWHRSQSQNVWTHKHPRHDDLRTVAFPEHGIKISIKSIQCMISESKNPHQSPSLRSCRCQVHLPWQFPGGVQQCLPGESKLSNSVFKTYFFYHEIQIFYKMSGSETLLLRGETGADLKTRNKIVRSFSCNSRT